MRDGSTPHEDIGNIVEQLESSAHSRPADGAITFLDDDGGERVVSFGELDRKARHIAARLSTTGRAGDRVLVVFDSGPEFVFCVWGVLYAGMVVVPADPPGLDRPALHLLRLRASREDSGATMALSSRATLDFLRQDPTSAELVSRLAWHVVSDVPETDGPSLATPIRSVGSHPAALLYTSGSTGNPKGTIIRHAMLDRAVRRRVQILRATGATGGPGGPPFDIELHWLPMSHATNFMNLFYNCLGGIRSLWMTPQQFVRSPMNWLRAIARLSPLRVKALAPNFALDWCVSSTTAAERESLDLANLCSIVSVGERIRPETVRAFRQAFEPARARPVLLAIYGSTETGVIALAANGKSVAFSRRALDAGSLESAETGEVELQSSGPPAGGVDVLIVDPETREPVPANRTGEIWVRSGDFREGGYWNREEENERQFRARTAAGDGPFFRTGDLGGFHDGALFVVGRLKQMVIIRGQKHYAEDLEETVERHLDWIRASSTIAFADDADGESLVLAIEVAAGEPDLRAKAERVRAVIAEHFGVRVKEVLFVARGDLPRTNTGKVSRNECRQLFREGRLGILERHGNATPMGAVTFDVAFETVVSDPDPRRRAERIADCMKTLLSSCAGIPLQEIRATLTFRELGIDSATGVRIRALLDAWVGQPLPSSLLYSYPSIEAASRYLAVGPSARDVEVGQKHEELHSAHDLGALDVDAMSESEALAALEAYLDKGENLS